MEHYKVRFGNLELRTTGIHLLGNEEHATAEIVQWSEEDCCWTIAFWKMNGVNYELLFVGDRPFHEKVNPDTFWKLAKMGQKHLEKKEEDYLAKIVREYGGKYDPFLAQKEAFAKIHKTNLDLVKRVESLELENRKLQG